MLPLCIDTTTHTRRGLWTAWDTDGRCGHWSALHRLGVAIRACPLDQPLAEFRRALPTEQRRRQRAGAPKGELEYYTHDPETDVRPIDPVRRPTGRGVAV